MFILSYVSNFISTCLGFVLISWQGTGNCINIALGFFVWEAII